MRWKIVLVYTKKKKENSEISAVKCGFILGGKVYNSFSKKKVRRRVQEQLSIAKINNVF